MLDRARVFGLILGAAVLQACSSRAPAPAAIYASRRDSAGVEIVETMADSVDTLSWRLSDKPLLDIGDTGDSLPPFVYPGSAIQLPHGEIAVAPSREGAIVVFDSTGRQLRLIGRHGPGPGEFDGKAWDLLLFPGDTLGGIEQIGTDLELFRPDGHFVRQLRIQRPNLVGRNYQGFLGFAADGELLIKAEQNPRLKSGDEIQTVFAIAPTGEVRRRLGTFPVEPERRKKLALFTSFVADDSSFHYTDAEFYEIRTFGLDGRLRRIARLRRPRRAVDEAFLDQTYRQWVRSAEQSAKEMGKPMLKVERPQRSSFPDSLAAFAALRRDVDGNIWAMECPNFETDDQVWWVFNRAGRVVARVRVPLLLRVSDIQRDKIIGPWITRSQEGHVRVYRLIRGNDGRRSG